MLGLVAICLLASTSNIHAETLDSTVIGMFPKDVSDFGYADLSQARQLSWYPQFEAQLVPVALFEFEQFLQAIQMRQSSPINQVAWATVGSEQINSDTGKAGHSTSRNEQPVAVAVGDFDIETIKAYVDSKNIPSIQSQDHILYASGTGSGPSNIFFTLLDSHAIAFGSLQPLERVLKIRDGEEDSLLQNQEMMTLIERANGEGIFWGVLDSGGAARAIDRLIPEAAKFPQSRDLMKKLADVLITVKAPGDIELELKAASASPGDAGLTSQLFQIGVLLQRYQTNSDTNPEMAKLLDALRITSNGARIAISLELTTEQIISLIEHNTFIFKM